MADINATILIPIDLQPGSTATNYAPSSSTICPVLSMLCVGSSGSGNVKITPLRATEIGIGGSGSGARLRIATNGSGTINAVEIAAGGTGFANGPVPITLVDPFGTDGVIACTASGGTITSASIVAGGVNYSGYVLMDVSDFIEGVTYTIIPRFVEQTSGSGTLRLYGNKLAFRPFQVF